MVIYACIIVYFIRLVYCWCISAAGIIADNFVVSGLVDWEPNLSTTWSLACYTQNGCKGGNPAKLFEDIAKGGIASNHCIDYSWCEEDSVCNGSALNHFDKAKVAQEVNALNSRIPTCGCYFANKHYLYKIEPNSKTIFIGAQGVSEDNIATLVKKHVHTYGPALGGFLVFNNFMRGTFSKVNGGVYLERCKYGAEMSQEQELTFSDDEVSGTNYKGAHAVAIIGWGVEKNIIVDNGGKRANVPYWYCRNSWDSKWANEGYFKMAMYPWNKISQFDKRIFINDSSGMKHLGGGIILARAIKPPELLDMKQIEAKFRDAKRKQTDAYYTSDGKTAPIGIGEEKQHTTNTGKKIFKIIAILLLLFFIVIIVRKLRRKNK